ncbi:MAG: hypothetical protein R3E01_04580 [Pirellulaceae bacterium]|nr:hypothetical protein [Planctomycetales bacterium]
MNRLTRTIPIWLVLSIVGSLACQAKAADDKTKVLLLTGFDAKQNPSYQKLVVRSVAWAATGKVAAE